MVSSLCMYVFMSIWLSLHDPVYLCTVTAGNPSLIRLHVQVLHLQDLPEDLLDHLLPEDLLDHLLLEDLLDHLLPEDLLEDLPVHPLLEDLLETRLLETHQPKAQQVFFGL